jgi:hypothetical protein
MAGAVCPTCGKKTVFESLQGKECTKCDFKMVFPKANGKGGPGRKCMSCKKMKVHGDTCTECGAKHHY